MVLGSVDVLHDGKRKPTPYGVGPISSFTADRSRVIVSGEMIQEAGEIVGAVVDGAGGGVRGQFYAELEVGRGSRRFTEVARGYFYEGFTPSLEDRIEPGPIGGHGNLRTVDLGDPAANAEYAVQTVPTDALWLVRTLAGNLVTDATAANRTFRGDYRDTADAFLGGFSSGAAHIASLTVAYRGGIGVAPNMTNATALASGNLSQVVFALPKTYLPEGWDILFDTQNRQATDNWGDGQMEVEEWLVV